jgi:hypothetical protein
MISLNTQSNFGSNNNYFSNISSLAKNNFVIDNRMTHTTIDAVGG